VTLRKLAVLLAFLALIMGTYAAWWRSERQALDKHIAALRAAGHPVTALELQPAYVTDENNAAKALLDAQWWLEQNIELDFTPLDAVEYDDTTAWTAKEWDEFYAFLDSLEPYYALLAQVHERDGWYLDYEFERGGCEYAMFFGELRDPMHYTVARAQYDRVQEGRTERAAQAALLCLAVYARYEPVLFLDAAIRSSTRDYAARIVRNAIEQPGFDAAVFRRLVDPAVVAAIPARGPAAAWLRAERAVLIEIAAEGKLDQYYGEGAPYGGVWLARPLAYRDLVAYSEDIERGAALLDTTPEKAARLMETYTGTGPEWLFGGMLVSRSCRLFVNDVTSLRLLRVVMALLEAHQRDGSWPKSLPAGMPPDPRTGSPFVYTHTKDGVRVQASVKGKTFATLVEDDLAWELKR